MTDESGNSRGFGFVDFERHSYAEKVCDVTREDPCGETNELRMKSLLSGRAPAERDGV